MPGAWLEADADIDIDIDADADADADAEYATHETDLDSSSTNTATTASPPPMPITPFTSNSPSHAIPNAPIPSPPPAAESIHRRLTANASSSTSDRRRAKRASSSGLGRRPGPSSPALITNLIDSLSSVEIAHYDPLPSSSPLSDRRSSRTAPGTPVLRQRRSFGGESGGSPRVSDFSSYRNALAEDLEGADDAAEPPVIRTSKRPSGYSELTSPKEKKHNGLASYIRSGYARSTSSIVSSHRDDDAKSIGNGSSDNINLKRSNTNASRDSLDSRRSRKNGRKRAAQASPESLHEANVEMGKGREAVMQVAGISDAVCDSQASPLHSSPMRLHSINAPIEEEPPSLGAISPRSRDLSKREGKKPVGYVNTDGSTSPGHGNGPAVPSRRSSLRHQDTPERKSRRNSHQNRSLLSKQTAAFGDLPEISPSFSPASVDSEDTEVTKRIKELKAQKELREKEARQSPTPEHQYNDVSQNTVRRKNHGPDSQTPARYDPSQSVKRSSPDARGPEQLGDILVHLPGPLSDTPKKHVRNAVVSNRHVESEWSPTPLTPTALPINYSYVIQTLSQYSAPPGSRAPSSKDSVSVRPPQRRTSIAVGSRSVTGRVTVTRIDEISAARSKSSSPEPRNPHAETNSFDDLQSATSLDTKKSKKKKRAKSAVPKQSRGSQPEVPATVERSGSAVAPDSLEVRPPEMAVEERPSSRDSVDQEVTAFIHAARLSQKIRHPSSGRTVAFSEVGDPDGHAVFCCVGMGLTRYVTAFYDELATTLRLRLITPDRPGVGESQVDPNGQPLTWPDDVSAICSALGITKFSIMAHSAGAIYALATALRMPQHIRGRVHLLAPWIPPSQMAPIGITTQDPPPGAQLPKSQRFLRVLPAPFLKVANAGMFGAASASLSPSNTKTPGGRKKRKSFLSKEGKESKEGGESREESQPDSRTDSHSRSKKDPNTASPSKGLIRRESILLMDQQNMPDGSVIAAARSNQDLHAAYTHKRQRSVAEDAARREIYDSRLTLSIWAKATANANPAIDLLICLERYQPIGFMYKDITRAVVIHHGSKDTRVPVENVRWLGSAMRRCEVRVLEGQGHGLMAIPSVMGSVLEEIGREWRDWEAAVKRGTDGDGTTLGAFAGRKAKV